MVFVREYLKTKSLEDLEREHGVKARVHEYKFSLNYDHIESREDDLLAQQCRGLILRPTKIQELIDLTRPIGDTVILARSFDRFFNYGQSAAAEVDFNHPATSFYEKMDGTLCIVYYDDVKNEWHVATRSLPEANLPVDGSGEYTFRTLFEKALEETVGKDFESWTSAQLFRDTTYMFELTSPANRIVVEYEGHSITLLAARKTATGKELRPAFVQAQVKTPTAERYRFGSVSELVDFVSSRDPIKHEGIVVCDQHFRRIKIKNAGYLALNKVRDSVLKSPRGLVELLLLEKLDDALPLFPDHVVDRAHKLQASFRDLVANYRDVYEACLAEVAAWNESRGWIHEKGSKEHRKMFALAVQARKGWMAPMMEQYQGRVSGLVDWIQSKRHVDGGWSNSFLDTVLQHLEN